MSVDDYERKKKALTEKELQKLTESEEYKAYMKKKANGELKDLKLDEDDKIDLSDDSDIGDA